MPRVGGRVPQWRNCRVDPRHGRRATPPNARLGQVRPPQLAASLSSGASFRECPDTSPASWLPNRAIEYFRGRDSEALQFLPELIAANKPKKLNGETKALPNRRAFCWAEPSKNHLVKIAKTAPVSGERTGAAGMCRGPARHGIQNAEICRQFQWLFSASGGPFGNRVVRPGQAPTVLQTHRSTRHAQVSLYRRPLR